VEVRQAQAFLGESIQCGRRYFTTKRTDIRVTHVIGNDEQNVGSLSYNLNLRLNFSLLLSLLLRLFASGNDR
jgi:hypothetical protein